MQSSGAIASAATSGARRERCAVTRSTRCERASQGPVLSTTTSPGACAGAEPRVKQGSKDA